ncbi:MAG: SDR family NAD(P)-dependent oxidoreductase, partial [Pseudooceanicola sp.]|nr:SDR family NAD(P)-dependent oxidoreductase [Pseudooceanicola sp.]
MTRCLVTGAGKRLGRAMALYLAGRGFDVALHCSASRDGAEAAAADIRALGRRAEVLQADFLDETEVQSLFRRATEALGGPVTCLVNNASIFEYDTVASATRASWDRHLDSNLRAPFVLTQGMAAQGLQPLIDDDGEPVAVGLIVNIIDQRVLKPTPEFMTYT